MSLRPQFDSDDVCKFIIQQLKNPLADKSFLNNKFSNLKSWTQDTREWVKELLLYSPEKVSFDPIVAEELDFGDYIRKKLYFYTAKDCKVSAYLLMPKNIDAPLPAIVALHDHSAKFYWGKEKIVEHKESLTGIESLQRYRYGGRGYASELAKRGYIVMVIDALGWGERGWNKESWLLPYIDGLKEGSDEYIKAYDEISTEMLDKVAKTILYSGATYMGIMLWDDIRTVDFLCSLPEVNKDRIGCIGLSMGGYRAAWLAAMDERIKCSCPVAYIMRYEDMITERRQLELWQVVPGLYNRLTYPDLISLAMPRSVLGLYCQNDHLFALSSMERAIDTIAMAYKKAGEEDRFESKGFPVGHQFDYDMQEYAFDWFDRRL